MKYIPQSKLGAVAAGIYLLFMALLLLIIGTQETGGHANPVLLIYLLALTLTFPLSWAAAWLWDLSNIETTNQTAGFVLFFAILIISALFNAWVIYTAVKFLSRAVRSLFTRLK